MRVGTSMQMTIRSNGAMDHPHACGDKLTHKQSPAQRRGSSPCVWGQAATLREQVVKERIIPMRVGTRTPHGASQRSYWDHPHACGDK